MRIWASTSFPSPSLLFFLPSIFSSVAYATSPGCDHVRAHGKSFKLSSLGGAHSFWTIEKNEPHDYNTTYTLDICSQLKRDSSKDKDEQCHHGAWVCAVKRKYDETAALLSLSSINASKTSSSEGEVQTVINVAGDFSTNFGGSMDSKWTLLSDSSSHADSEKEGLRLEMNGGRSPFTRDGRKQMAVIEFLCDKDRDGLEDDPKKSDRLRGRDSDEDEDEDIDKNDGRSKSRSLRFLSYDTSGEVDKLRLEWRTKVACEDFADNDSSTSKHWGFFTWIIIIAFLGIAAYLIFGSWLNYNRYGARGWDLLPHGDTIRDVPYLMKDFARRVVNTVQGGGSRGGYSAV